MRELGPDSEEMHVEIANKLLSSNASAIVLVGDEMRKYVYPLISEAFEGRVWKFSSSRVA